LLDARVVKRRRSFTVDVALRAERGASVALFGPSGAGKSTVLACIAGFEAPDAGHVRLGDRALFPPNVRLDRRGVGYLRQDAGLFPHLTVAANVTFGLDGRRAADAAWVEELRERLQLTDVWRASAARVSGGQERRAALARTLARKPSLVLLDEPFAALDRDIVRDLIANLTEWRERIGFTIVAVDHDADALAHLCTQVVAIERGTVVQSGTWPELRERTASNSLARLLAQL